MKKSRIAVLMGILGLVCVLFVFRLIQLQLVDGKSYRSQSMSRVVTKSEIPAARGEILDRYCRPLVRNESTLSVGLNLKRCKDVNGTLARMIGIFQDYGQEYTDRLPISASPPYIYTGSSGSETTLPKTFVNYLTSLKIDSSLPAEAVLEKLIHYYKLEELSPSLARAVVSVRYEIYRTGSSGVYQFATKVPIEVVTALKERSDELIGVEISSDYDRSYTEENFASHILGYLGPLSEAEYAAKKESGYSINDTIGKSGIEKICEDQLRGKSGVRFLEINASGAVTTELPDKGVAEVVGSDVVLTIDKNLQKITESSLATAVENDRKLNGEDAGTSASAVFLEIATGEILSLASNPSYNLSTFYQDYPTLSKETVSSPYVNRAIAGAFPPGSTWKIITAIAGLEEGIITERTTYHCTGRYTYYQSYQPTCNDKTAHGTVNVEQALQKSCNCFFYDVGRQLGSDKLAEYAARFGFGEKTGVELAGELSGVIASRSLRTSQGGVWQSGETLLAAIGQTDNTATPLQLAVMAATVANNGVRMQPHIIKSIINRDTGECTEYLPNPVCDTGISEKTLSIVRRGMYMVANEPGGTAYSSFRNFDIRICGKSGTAETPPGQAAALFVGYAPVDNPTIAFSVVIEHGGKGAYAFTTQVIKDVLSYYFSNQDSFDSVQEINTLLP